jgi:hypothetical protein
VWVLDGTRRTAPTVDEYEQEAPTAAQGHRELSRGG